MGNFAQQLSSVASMTNLTSSTNTDIVENRPEYQTVMVGSEFFAHLLQPLPKKNVDAKTKQAIVSAISACVRTCPTA